MPLKKPASLETEEIVRKVCALCVCFILMSAVPVWAQSSPANRQTLLNNVTDWIATAGKPKVLQQRIRTERQKARREARMVKQRERKVEQTQKRMKKQENVIMRKQRAKQKAHGY